MADLSDVENALVSAITAAVYPNGTGGPSVFGASTRIYRGWPNARALDADLAAGVVNITVFPMRGMTRNTTRFPLVWETVSTPTPTITAAFTASAVTFGGAAGAGNLCGIRAGGHVYAYAAAPTDTPAAVAAALAAMIPGAVSGGPVVTLPGVPDLLGRVVAYGAAMLMETRRQEQGFLISAWCPNATARDVVCGTVDAALAPIEFLTLADGTGGRLLYRQTRVDDAPTKDALWRRDLVYTVEYPTTLIQNAAEMLFGLGTTNVTVLIGSSGPVTVATTPWEPQ